MVQRRASPIVRFVVASTEEPWLDRRPVARWRIENVTHALAGILAAHVLTDLVERSSRAPREAWTRTRRTAVIVSALANNVPDTDLVYSWITKGPLGYLLHHRGHTHTLPIAITLGLIVAAIALKIAKPPIARWLVVLVGGLGPVIHLSMDAWNIYGVHPFWPFDSRWYYGDRIFILEPLFWITAIPAVFVRSKSSVFRGVLVTLFGLILLAPWLLPSFVPLPIRFALLGVAALCAWIAWRDRQKEAKGERGTPAWIFARTSLRSAVGAWLLVLAMFSVAHQRAEQLATFALYEEMPGVVVEDIALTPLPANPLCFTAIVTAIPEPAGDRFIVRRGAIEVFDLGVTCPRAESQGGTAPLAEVASRPPVEWLGEIALSRSELREFAKRCDVGAAMQFYRAPFWVRDGETLTFGDLRFDRSPGPDFPEVTVDAAAPSAAECPRFVTNWTPPRARMLAPP